MLPPSVIRCGLAVIALLIGFPEAVSMSSRTTAMFISKSGAEIETEARTIPVSVRDLPREVQAAGRELAWYWNVFSSKVVAEARVIKNIIEEETHRPVLKASS